MGAIFPRHGACSCETHEDIVYERSRLDGLSGTFAAKVGCRKSTKIWVEGLKDGSDAFDLSHSVGVDRGGYPILGAFGPGGHAVTLAECGPESENGERADTRSPF